MPLRHSFSFRNRIRCKFPPHIYNNLWFWEFGRSLFTLSFLTAHLVIPQFVNNYCPHFCQIWTQSNRSVIFLLGSPPPASVFSVVLLFCKKTRRLLVSHSFAFFCQVWSIRESCWLSCCVQARWLPDGFEVKSFSCRLATCCEFDCRLCSFSPLLHSDDWILGGANWSTKLSDSSLVVKK